MHMIDSRVPTVREKSKRSGKSPNGQGKVREKGVYFKVREKSWNFEIGQGKMVFWQKSGKSQVVL